MKIHTENAFSNYDICRTGKYGFAADWKRSGRERSEQIQQYRTAIGYSIR